MKPVHPSAFVKARFVFIFLTCCTAATLFSCSKEGFDIESTTIHTASPDTLYVADCPNLWLNVGDSCESAISNLEGIVSPECTCDVDFSSANEEFVSVAIVNPTAGTRDVSVTSSNPLMQGECCIQLTSGSSTSEIYAFPAGTNDVVIWIAFDCENGPGGEQFHLFNSAGIHGASADFVIGCPN